MVKRSPKAGLTSKLCGGTPSVRPRALPERICIMSKILKKSTELCVNLKTILLHDARMKPGKNYMGILVKDFEGINPWEDDHFKFVENPPSVPEKRNTRVFYGRYVTVTMRPDGSFRPNLKPVRIEDGFDVDDYATSVANELLHALSCLV